MNGSNDKIDKFDKKLFQMAAQEKMISPNTLNEKVDAALRELPNKIYRVNLRRTFILVAVFTMLFSITVTASVGILRERMESLNREKLEEFFNQIYQSKIPSDNYNRYLTDAEQVRKEELKQAYEDQGVFPEGELTLIDAANDYSGKGVAYLADTGTFFFPEQEMTDEQLLQLIDFIYKRDYSLQKVNELIEAGEADISEVLEPMDKAIGETDAALLESNAIWDPGQELTIAYTGDLSILSMTAGKRNIYLGGWNAIHKMAIGSSDSELIYDDFEKDTRITCMHEDSVGNVYFAGMETESVQDPEDASKLMSTHTMALWKLDSNGKLLKKIDLSEYSGEYGGIVTRIAVDKQGNIYLNGRIDELELFVLNAEGEFVTAIDSGQYYFHTLGGLGMGKDGNIYTMIYSGTRENDSQMGIAAIDVAGGKLGDTYLGIVPDETIMLDIIAPGSDTDLVFWGYDGIFTYNLGEEEAINVLPAYEAPCNYEGVVYCALSDGRILFASATEYIEEISDDGQTRYLRKPEKTTFYYMPGLRER